MWGGDNLENIYVLTSNGGFISQNELYHHGIKGMKWGIRRFQNEDGSLTSAGKKRYDDGSTGSDKRVSSNSDSKTPRKGLIQKRKDTLTERYISKGYKPEAAKTMAEQRMRTEAVLAVVGAVAVTAVAIKVARRIGQDYVDQTFKSGKVIQNIGANPDANFKDAPFFAAVNRADKKAYGMNYANEKRRMAKAYAAERGLQYQGIFNNQVKLTGDVKRASVANAQKIFYEKMDKDPQFKKEVLETLKKTNYSDGKAIGDYVSNGKHSRKLYDRFNQALATPQFQDAGIHKKYYDEMKKHGYNAILDINDTRYSGYKKISKSPTIFFGDDKWEKISSRKLSDTEIDENATKFAMGYLAKNQGKSIAKVAGAVAGLVALGNQADVNQYIKEHPNTKLSRQEILERVREGKV